MGVAGEEFNELLHWEGFGNGGFGELQCGELNVSLFPCK